MYIYIMLYCIAGFGALIPQRIENNTRKLFLLIFSLYMVFFVGFRNQIGGDWYNYLDIFEKIKGATLSEAIVVTDPAYALLNWFAESTGFEIYFVNFWCAAIFFIGLCSFINKIPSNCLALTISLPYLITAVAMGYTRQSAAIGLILLAYISIMDRKFFKFVFYVLAASMFHKTAVIIFGFWPLINHIRSIKKILISALCIISFSFLLLKDTLAPMWELYILNDMQSGGAVYRILLNAIPAILFLFFLKKKWYVHDRKTYFLTLILSVLAVICIPIVFLSSTVVDRISLYLMPLQLLVYTHLSFFMNLRVRWFVTFSIVIAYFILYITWLAYSPWAECCWIPYKFSMW